MKRIEKKAIPELFEKVLSGAKTFDVRLNRFICKPGDILILREWDPRKKEYTGRQIEKTVSYVLKTKDIEKFWDKKEIEKYGFQVICFKS
ncbi:DUF3850 domain-containing protein [Patescibacteria group bacterium]|nr:DUF3850 domain-containing protein [Patescibacteria group bacterium]